MNVYQTDADGFYVGITEAQPDPLTPGEFLLPGGAYTTKPPQAGAGQLAQMIDGAWHLVDEAVEPEPEPIPEPTPEEALEVERAGMVASRFQAKAALMQAGHLPAVETAIEQADDLTKLAWAEVVEMRRTSPMIAALALAIDLTPEDVDDLFRVAMQIEA